MLLLNRFFFFFPKFATRLPDKSDSIYDIWLASRRHDDAGLLAPGSHRPFTLLNVFLAYAIVKTHAFELFRTIWVPRTSLVLVFNIFRGLSPAFRGYSQSLIIDEVQLFFSSSGFTWWRLLRLLMTEGLRMILESSLDAFASNNETIVQSSTRFLIEYQQLEKRLQLDVPTLSDPVVRDLFHESDLFVRSFSGMTSFGLLSPFDFVSMLTLVSEIFSHLFVIYSMTKSSTHVLVLLFSVVSSILPLVLPRFSNARSHPDYFYSPAEAACAEKQEKMRHLAHSDPHRPEVLLFGLSPWILSSWAQARKTLLRLEKPSFFQETAFFGQVGLSEILVASQQIPLVMMIQSSSASLGSLTLYRTSVQSLIYTIRNMINMMRLAFQGIFLMGAFCCAMQYAPKLQPKKEDEIPYQPLEYGMKIEARNISFTYPGSKEPALKNISFTLEAGETLAIVGCNGSGKSTLANVILRILDFDDGELLINGSPIERYNPFEFHTHLTAVFQSFSKHNGTARDNIGIGYVDDIDSTSAVSDAVELARASHIIDSLPDGLNTKLDTSGFFNPSFLPANLVAMGTGEKPSYIHHGMSGGEWQRIAISRAFMRARRPEVNLLLFDEPTSSLDSHAQNDIFDTIESISRTSSGVRTKTVIWITHRLTTARRADKIAMVENGTIIEFGTHAQLLALPKGSYAALYNASV